MDAFGEATVVVIADHGWDVSGYGHFQSPEGVLLIGPTTAPGFGGPTDVRRVAPTVLALLGLSLDRALKAPLGGLSAKTASAPFVWRRQTLAPAVVDPAILDRLHTLGSLAR